MDNMQVVWTFGPDDKPLMLKIKEKVDFKAILYQPTSILDFCYLINDSKLLVSTSTGPMHLAGVLNIKTMSFFGNNLFASPKRWATISNKSKQSNLILDKKLDFKSIKNKLLNIVTQ